MNKIKIELFLMKSSIPTEEIQLFIYEVSFSITICWCRCYYMI